MVVMSYLVFGYMLTCTPVASRHAHVRAMSSAFCVEVPIGSGCASMTASRVTTLYLAKCVLHWTKLLQSVKYSMFG
jgi:hypothetical protein